MGELLSDYGIPDISDFMWNNIPVNCIADINSAGSPLD